MTAAGDYDALDRSRLRELFDLRSSVYATRGGAFEDDPYPAFQSNTDVDMKFNHKPCTPYTTRSGIQSSWCFDPAVDPPPAEQEDQCGDHWNRPTNLTNDWTFYMVPFSSMVQQGFAKRSNQLDLTAVSVFRFTWDGGWVDFYVDKIRFYRHKVATPDAAAD